MVAQTERVAPLLYWTFRNCGWPKGMPEAVRKALAGTYYATASRNMLLYHELARILSALEQREIPVILLKGAALAETLYLNLSLRPMGDLDLLVSKEQLDQAIIAVKALGYVPERPQIRAGLEQLVAYETNFDGGECSPTHVELHWNLIGGRGSRYRPRIEWFWEQSEPIELLGLQALTLNATAHLLYLAAHVTLKHGRDEARLLWFHDLHLLISHSGELDWQELLARADEFDWASGLRAALRGTQGLFSTPVPEEVGSALGGDGDQEAGGMRRHNAGALQTRIASTWQDWSALHWPVRLRCILATVIPSRAYITWRYAPHPAWLWPFYYPYRWLDMLGDGLSTLVKLAYYGLYGRMRSGSE